MAIPRKILQKYRSSSPLKTVEQAKPRTGVPVTLLEGKKRGNLIFTGSGVRLRKV